MSQPRRCVALLDELLAATDRQALSSVADALVALDDPGSVKPLFDILCDQGAPTAVREAASRVLDRLQNAPDYSAQQLRAWWHAGDLVLQRHALGHANEPWRGIVEGILNDPSHPLRVDAVETLTSEFEADWATERLIAALGHPSSEARTAAAESLYWTERVRALPALVAAAHDPAPSVAIKALDTLRFYCSRQAISAAHALRTHADSETRDAAQRCWEDLRADVLGALCQRRTELYLRAFFAPVWSLLSIQPSDIEEIRAPSTRSPAREEASLPEWLASPDTLRAFLLALDVERDERETLLYRVPWERVPEEQRGEIARLLAQSPDVVVRQPAARVAGTFRQRDVLLALLDDAKSLVRKSATYFLRELPPEPALAARVWSRLPSTTGIDATQTLETAVALDAPRIWWPRVAALVRASDVEEELRCAAVHELKEAGAADLLIPCMQLLLQPPPCTWALHIALLDAAIALRLPLPNCSHLADEDDLHLQWALAELAVRT